MKKIASFLFLLCCTITFLCSCGHKNYNVSVSNGVVRVKMHCPTMGIIGINQVGYDGFTYEDVEKEVFDKIRRSSYKGKYSVVVTLQFKDKYGNFSDGTPVTVSTLDASEVKRYKSYSYFKGSSHISDAFPWNRRR